VHRTHSRAHPLVATHESRCLVHEASDPSARGGRDRSRG
jgi:hypothetical protein